MNSLSHGAIQQLFASVTIKSIEFMTYTIVYAYLRVVTLPEDSKILWILCFLGYDLGYYWFHRLSHEINFIWASHIVHHSSEDYNLSTALRQSAFQNFMSWPIYLPMALFIPPSLFSFHRQVNTVYQFYIHTQIIGKMGFLEYFLNTPSHHRVHHGRNRKYIDKNYGGIFIIWDKLFGTFEEEKEVPVYGLVHPSQSWDVIEGQIGHFKHIYRRIKEEKTISDKLSVLFKGPGWEKGKPRLGVLEDIPEVDHKTATKYDSNVSTIDTLYVSFHFMVILFVAILLVTKEYDSYFLHFAIVGYAVFSFSCFSRIFDRKPNAYVYEFIRIAGYTTLEIICWRLYKEDFTFLWYTELNLSPTLTLAVHIIRAIYVITGFWFILKSISKLYPDKDYKENINHKPNLKKID